MLQHLVIAVWASKKATALGYLATLAQQETNGRSVLRKRDNGGCANIKLILNKHHFVVGY